MTRSALLANATATGDEDMEASMRADSNNIVTANKTPSSTAAATTASRKRSTKQLQDTRWLVFLLIVTVAALVSFVTSHVHINRLSAAVVTHENDYSNSVNSNGGTGALVAEAAARRRRVAMSHHGGGGSGSIHAALHMFMTDYHSHHHNPHTYKNETFVYDHDVVCPRCHTVEAVKGLTCGARLHKYMSEDATLNETAAAIRVAHEYPDTCGHVCIPHACNDIDKALWRYDDAAPMETRSIVHFLPSVIAQYRLPGSIARVSSNINNKNATNGVSSNGDSGRSDHGNANLTAYLSVKKNQYPRRMYLFEYNPSIIILPEPITAPDHPDEPPAVYLASYRVSNVHQCIVGDDLYKMIGEHWPRPVAENLLGLALLREDLTILQDVVVDIKTINYRMENYRLFVLHNQIYVSSSGIILPIYLTEPKDIRRKMTVPNLFPSNFSIIARQSVSCYPNENVRRKGKNLNYFTDAETGQVMVEIWPLGPKFPVDLEKTCETKFKDQIGPNKFPPHQTWRTVDNLHLSMERAVTGDRGGACCLHYRNDKIHDGKALLIGISHERMISSHIDTVDDNIDTNTFFSRFYVMEGTAPYTPVSRTGKFCLGFPTSEAEANVNPYAYMNMDQLKVGDVYNCPRIHFVTGLSYRANDTSKMIIGYGVNECIPRFVEVKTDDVIALLFPSDELLESNAVPIVEEEKKYRETVEA